MQCLYTHLSKCIGNPASHPMTILLAKRGGCKTLYMQFGGLGRLSPLLSLHSTKVNGLLLVIKPLPFLGQTALIWPRVAVMKVLVHLQRPVFVSEIFLSFMTESQSVALIRVVMLVFELVVPLRLVIIERCGRVDYQQENTHMKALHHSLVVEA